MGRGAHLGASCDHPEHDRAECESAAEPDQEPCELVHAAPLSASEGMRSVAGTPSAAARAAMVPTVASSPLSIRATVLVATPAVVASTCWVSPAVVRADRSRVAMSVPARAESCMSDKMACSRLHVKALDEHSSNMQYVAYDKHNCGEGQG